MDVVAIVDVVDVGDVVLVAVAVEVEVNMKLQWQAVEYWLDDPTLRLPNLCLRRVHTKSWLVLLGDRVVVSAPTLAAAKTAAEKFIVDSTAEPVHTD